MLRDYIPLKVPEGKEEGLLFSRATGIQLDIFGNYINLKRRKVLFIKEPDFLYKIRLRNKAIKEHQDT